MQTCHCSEHEILIRRGTILLLDYEDSWQYMSRRLCIYVRHAIQFTDDIPYPTIRQWQPQCMTQVNHRKLTRMCSPRCEASLITLSPQNCLFTIANLAARSRAGIVCRTLTHLSPCSHSAAGAALSPARSRLRPCRCSLARLATPPRRTANLASALIAHLRFTTTQGSLRRPVIDSRPLRPNTLRLTP